MSRVSRRTMLAAAGAGIAAAATFPAPRIWAQGDFMAPAKLRAGLTPYISSGPAMIAEAKGYFAKMNLTVETTSYVDGSLSMPSLAAGELDIAGATISAGLFNLVAKGTGIKLFMERGREAPGWGSNAIMVSNALYEKGFTDLAGYKHAKGQKIGISSRGSVAHYLHTIALQKAGLTVDDVDWQWGMDPRVSLPLMKQNSIGIINLPLPGAYAAQKQGIGRVVTWSDEIDPNFVLACSAASTKLLTERNDAVVRFIMAIMQANKDYMDCAKNGDPEILKIMAEGTKLPVPVIDETRPRWTYMVLDGQPNIPSIMAQQKYWHEKTDLLAKAVTQEQLFDLKAIAEARKRLDDKNPFI